MTEEHSVLKWLPKNGERVLCYGYHTYCCKEDMEKKPQWHEVTFKLDFSYYKLKKEIPSDPDESIIEDSKIVESWDCGDDFSDGEVIGVTKWKFLPEE